MQMSPAEEQLWQPRMCRGLGEDGEAEKHVLMSPGEQQLWQQGKCRKLGHEVSRPALHTMRSRAVADASLD